MADRLRSIPGLRDVLVASYELAGWLVLSVVSSITRRDVRGTIGVLIIGGVLVVIINLDKAWPAAIAFGVFAFVVVIIRAWDIARVRAALRGILDDPTCDPPELREALKDRSPTIEALHGVATSLSLAYRGKATQAEREGARVDRDYLDREGCRCLDLAQALAADALGKSEEASRSAALALPVGRAALDRRLARMILRAAWNDPKRLKSIAVRWPTLDPILADLATLVSLRLQPPASRVDRIASLDPATLPQIAQEARELGDERLADDLVAHAKRIGPYR